MKTAIVTGGCSGIGLALVRHLLAKPDWQIVIGDINPDGVKNITPPLDQTRLLYVQTDVASWGNNANLFKKAYAYSGGRVDFFAANAGIGDREMLAGPFDLDAEPEKPNLACLDINEMSVFYGLKLFIFYTRKTKKALGDTAKSYADKTQDHAAFNPKMVITASCVGLYPFPIAPQYCASKHSLVGLTRSVGASLLDSDNISVNCIMPAYVATNIAPASLNEAWPKEWITPTDTMMRAYDELTDEEGKVDQDGLSNGKDGTVKTGQAVECVVNKLIYRDHYPFADESQQYLIEQAQKPDGLWVTHLKALFEQSK